DQLDYLFAALKKHGIYMTTDLFVSRPVYLKELWPEEAASDMVRNDYRMDILVNEQAFANYAAFATNLLTHVNPYTKMRWADDPALAWISLINEGNEGNFIGNLSTPRVKADWAAAWNKWLAARYSSRDLLIQAVGTLPAEQDQTKGTMPLPRQIDSSPLGSLFSCFMSETDSRFCARMRTLLRDQLHCSALITNLNGWTNPVQTQSTRQQFDYVDDHFYIDHPQFLEKSWQLPSRCPNLSPIQAGAPGGRGSAFIRLLDKPFTISEFNYSAPGQYRGVGGLLVSSLGAAQDWSVLWRFAYSHSRKAEVSLVPMDYFNLASDPLNQASDRASILLFRRGDLRPLPHTVGIVMTKNELLQQGATTHNVSPAWNALALVTRVGTQVVDDPAKSTINADVALPLSGKAPDTATPSKWLNVNPYATDATEKVMAEVRKRGWITAANTSNISGTYLQSETGEMTINGPANIFTLDTPRTVGGFAPVGGKIVTKAATIAIQGTAATVCISSLSDTPIAS
ncbi:MAG TPA: hypothetical protein VHV83_21095, partial [Armatimonadota bacterium]|nr:hypothetical protein [Armatimonadota bacterium]